jgi:two-component system, NarL family, sensor histidine kinase DevS
MADELTREQSERLIQENAARNRALLGQVINAQETERARVARELHDATGQALTSILFGLRAVIDATSLEAARSHARNLHRLAGQALDDVQRLARGLRPAALDDLGLVPALERIADDYRQLQGIDIRVNADQIGQRRFAPSIETTAYRIAQEALTNAVKHARATAVTVSLNESGAFLRMMIQDDGHGFDVACLDHSIDRSRHLGLSTMRERAFLAGGKFGIESAPGRGTTIIVELPGGD